MRRIITAAAWGLAFSFASQMVLAGAYGGWAGVHLGRGRGVDEIVASPASAAWAKWQKAVPVAASALGLALGLMGLLPGT